MLTLAIDSSQDIAVVALSDDLRYVDGEARAVRAQGLLDVVAEVLTRNDMGARDITRIAVGQGPGGFTSTRIGVTIARGMAAALDLPLAGVPTLAAVAHDVAAEHTQEPIWASVDARRGEQFARKYMWVSGFVGFSMVPRSELMCVANDQIEQLVAGTPHATALTPRGLAAVAATEPYGSVAEVLPLYGREPDAVPMAARR